jgi:CHAT domain-containing protein
MKKFVLSFFLIVLLFFCFPQNAVRHKDKALLVAYNDADKLYNQAEKLLLQSEDNETLIPLAEDKNRKALALFLDLIPKISKEGNDSLSFFTNLKAALIFHYFDSLPAAKQLYLQSLQYQNRLKIADSLFFKPALFTGSIYYSESNLDSATWYLKYAEQINDRYGGNLTESQRLYNISGAIYYQTGNYSLAVKYFEKAIAVLSENVPKEKSLLVNYKINTGIALMKLEQFDKARTIYEELLKENIYNNEVNHNLGFISLKENKFSESIQYFRKVNYTSDKKVVDLYLNMAMAFEGLLKKDSSELYVLKAKEENLKWYGLQANISNGLILKFQADELAGQKQFSDAIVFYQQAIMQFSPGFRDTTTENNPDVFISTFSFINLFNTLAAKGDALEKLYQAQKETKKLEHALAAYQSAFRLADFVEKTYNSDEARLLLGKIKYNVHSRPIDISLGLYELTKEKKYLEEAYYFDQQNKASVLTINIQENELRNSNSISKELFEKEVSLKTAITNLSLKAAQLTDSSQLQSSISTLRDYEIQLGKLQEKVNEEPAYRNRYFASKIPGIKELQKKLDNSTALLSFHLSKEELVVFVITGNQFEYYKAPLTINFFRIIDSFKLSLYGTVPGNRYNGMSISTVLYKSLITPLAPMMSNIERLIIIPDDELNYLPFEALADENGRYMVEKYSIQYQYSTALLEKEDNSKKAKGILAFAPFASKGFADSAGSRFSVLHASKDEIVDLQGEIFTDSGASKNNFLLSANHYGIIHLATHASVDNEIPLRSFIAFYPVSGTNPDAFKLYAQEIYNLKLDSTQLVILSACETGTGKLVKGEGLMSLSRAFAYAGCPDIITSLWKAEDKTTAFITKKLHYYLEKGYSKDKALQFSKLDFLKSNEIDPGFKSPNYWAHLIFIGNYEARHFSIGWWWIAIIIILVALIFLATKRKA